MPVHHFCLLHFQLSFVFAMLALQLGPDVVLNCHIIVNLWQRLYLELFVNFEGLLLLMLT